MIDIAANLAGVRARIDAACRDSQRDPSTVELLAVSKTHSSAVVREAYAAGQRTFGENRVQELVLKAAELGALPGLRWHMIGSLQTNKVRDLLAVDGVTLLHSLDRIGLADALQRELRRQARTLDVLLQLNATEESTKHGCPVDQAAGLLHHVQQKCDRLKVRGVMAMGPLQGDPAPVFRRVGALRAELAMASGLPLEIFSLGMSDDLASAIAAGSTLVRIGSAVFGLRG